MKTITQFKSIDSFATKRLIAEKVQPSDFDKFHSMNTNPEVMSTLGGLRTEVQTDNTLNWNLKQWEDNGSGLWMFYLKDMREWVSRGIREFVQRSLVY